MGMLITAGKLFDPIKYFNGVVAKDHSFSKRLIQKSFMFEDVQVIVQVIVYRCESLKN